MLPEPSTMSPPRPPRVTPCAHRGRTAQKPPRRLCPAPWCVFIVALRRCVVWCPPHPAHVFCSGALRQRQRPDARELQWDLFAWAVVPRRHGGSEPVFPRLLLPGAIHRRAAVSRCTCRCARLSLALSLFTPMCRAHRRAGSGRLPWKTTQTAQVLAQQGTTAPPTRRTLSHARRAASAPHSR